MLIALNALSREEFSGKGRLLIVEDVTLRTAGALPQLVDEVLSIAQSFSDTVKLRSGRQVITGDLRQAYFAWDAPNLDAAVAAAKSFAADRFLPKWIESIKVRILRPTTYDPGVDLGEPDPRSDLRKREDGTNENVFRYSLRDDILVKRGQIAIFEERAYKFRADFEKITGWKLVAAGRDLLDGRTFVHMWKMDDFNSLPRAMHALADTAAYGTILESVEYEVQELGVSIRKDVPQLQAS